MSEERAFLQKIQEANDTGDTSNLSSEDIARAAEVLKVFLVKSEKNEDSSEAGVMTEAAKAITKKKKKRLNALFSRTQSWKKKN